MTSAKRGSSAPAQSAVRIADFHAFEADGALDPDVRVFGPTREADFPVSRNLEPEYLTVDGGTAYATTTANPHSFTEVSLGASQRAIYVATTSGVDAFLQDTATGLLTALTAGTIPGLSSPGEVRH